MYVNEQAMLKNLPHNKKASNLYLKQELYGDVLLFLKNKESMYKDLLY
tara:strand:+ start:493 stop:636 length:144 start_codon:yes stop_codon:yes gene_type:complete